DIRRQNMIELLMYKALFAMAANRAEFVSLLFSRMPASPLDDRSTARDLFDSLEKAFPDPKLFDANLRRIKMQLHLEKDDEETIDEVYRVFFSLGPDLNYSSTSSYAPFGPSYSSLMTLTDFAGHSWSYLASEENFRFVKE